MVAGAGRVEQALGARWQCGEGRREGQGDVRRAAVGGGQGRGVEEVGGERA